MARRLAHELGYLYVDTGAMYRALALKALRAGVDPDDEAAMHRLAAQTHIDLQTAEASEGFGEKAAGATRAMRVLLDGADVTTAIRSPEVSARVSQVARIAGVRERLVSLQQQLAASGGVVMDGRDIGTVVLPEAEVKVYLTASLEERARRRLADLQDEGHSMSLEQVREDIARRDELDSSRAVSPLRQASDAVLVDTSGLSVDEVVVRLAALCRRVERGMPLLQERDRQV